MRYFYTKQPDGVTLDAYAHVGEFKIDNLLDDRIVPGSIEPFTRYTGWLVMNDMPDETTDEGPPIDPGDVLPLEGI